MYVIGLELSSPCRSVAVGKVENDRLIILSQIDELIALSPFILIEKALHNADIKVDDINGIAVGIGPGSYTGIRVGLAIIQGWYARREVKVYPIPSYHVLVQRAWEDGIRGEIVIAIDAQRGQYYMARFSIESNGWHQLCNLQLIDVSSLLSYQLPLYGPNPLNVPFYHKLYPSASSLLSLALITPPTSPQNIEPIYLRPVDFKKLTQR